MHSLSLPRVLARTLPLLFLSATSLSARNAGPPSAPPTSRLRDEPEQGVDDVHFHPAEPRVLRITLTRRF